MCVSMCLLYDSAVNLKQLNSMPTNRPQNENKKNGLAHFDAQPYSINSVDVIHRDWEYEAERRENDKTEEKYQVNSDVSFSN